MKKIILFLCALIISATAHAEEAESLQGLGTIGFAEETVEDSTFPLYLERMGDSASAILEWQRIIFNTTDNALKTRARIHLARLQIKQGKAEQATQVLQAIGAEDPTSPRIEEALYLLSVASDITAQPQDGATYRSRLQKLYPNGGFLELAERHTLWHNGIKGKTNFPEVATDKAKALKTRLELAPARDHTGASLATLLSVIPGLGHYYLGDWRTGFMAMVFNGILLWVFINALRNKQWANSTFFGLIVSIIYFGTMFSAHSLAHRNAFEERLMQMQQWRDLAPEHITPLTPFNISYTSPMELPLWAYRNIIGTFDGERGNGDPVNSYYATQAMKKHGTGLGTLMMVDRLLRDWREIENPLFEHFSDGRLRYVDPLARNDFWITST